MMGGATRKPTPRAVRAATPRPFRRTTPPPMRRRDRRFLVEQPILLLVGKKRLELVTEDVSYGGVFVRTSEQLPLRSLVRVETILPPMGVPFGAAGRVVHTLGLSGRDHGPGLGIEFYGLGRDEHHRWDEFVERVRSSSHDATERAEKLAFGDAVDPLFRHGERLAAVLKVNVASVEALATMAKRDFPRRSLFVLADVNLEIGTHVGLQILHPLTDDVFELSGRVRRCVHDGAIDGVEVALEVDDERAARFEEFVYDALAPLFDDEEVEPG